MKRKPKRLLMTSLVALTIVGASGIARAQATLSLEETKQCLIDERDIGRQKVSLDERRPVIARHSEDMDRLKRQVEEAQSRVFVGSEPTPGARAEYEALRDKQYSEFDRYSESERRFNSDIAIYNERLAGYNARCSDRRFTDYNLRLARQQLGWQ